jgi:hypothetical protein
MVNKIKISPIPHQRKLNPLVVRKEPAGKKPLLSKSAKPNENKNKSHYPYILVRRLAR